MNIDNSATRRERTTMPMMAPLGKLELEEILFVPLEPADPADPVVPVVPAIDPPVPVATNVAPEAVFPTVLVPVA
jgi:hypothetical protein